MNCVVMASVRRRKCLEIQDKLEIIETLMRGGKNGDIARNFGISSSSVSTIWKSRDKILSLRECGGKKRLRRPVYDKLDQAVLRWFRQQRALNLPIQGPILKTKAGFFARELGIADFKGSEGWLEKFKQRHGINFGKKCGDAKFANVNLVNSWLNTLWPKVKEIYQDQDIFNADETGLFFKLMPDSSMMDFKDEKCVSGELSQERLTIMVCANLAGTEKRKLTVIGKSKDPPCIKNVQHLPVTYRSNETAWMTSELFLEELRLWDKELRMKKRKIVLLVEDRPIHSECSSLENIKLEFFPIIAIGTSVLQPMNQGVIRYLKCNYRKQLLLKVVEEDGETSTIKILDAINFLSRAWENVTQETIRHAFKNAGLCGSSEVNTGPDEGYTPLSEWFKTYQTQNTFPPENLNSFVDIDADVATYAIENDNEIIHDLSAARNEKANKAENNVTNDLSAVNTEIEDKVQNNSDVIIDLSAVKTEVNDEVENHSHVIVDLSAVKTEIEDEDANESDARVDLSEGKNGTGDEAKCDTTDTFCVERRLIPVADALAAARLLLEFIRQQDSFSADITNCAEVIERELETLYHDGRR